MMKRNLKLISLYIAALLVLATVGCATKENKETNNSAAAETADLLYQATVSPNEHMQNRMKMSYTIRLRFTRMRKTTSLSVQIPIQSFLTGCST